MADTKITALAPIGAIDPANDVLPIVDVSNNSMAASGTTCRVTTNQLLQANAIASLASATISGALTVDTSTLKVDSANDRVGIGTASPAQFVHLSKSNTSTALTAPPVGGASLRIQNSSSTNNNFGSVEFYNAAGLFGASVNCQYTNQATPTNDLVFVVRGSGGGIEAARIDSSGNVGIGVTPAGTGGCLQLKSGITFPATQVASSDANTLDDYEEGTFTPTVLGSSIDGTASYSTQIGRYVKIGRQVTAWVYVDWGSGTGTGNLRFGGLPFTIVALASNNYPAASIAYFSNIALSANNVATVYGQNAEANVNVAQYPVGGGTASAVPYDTAGQIIFTITYEV